MGIWGSALLNTGENENENGGALLMGNQELRETLSKQVEAFRFYSFGNRNKFENLNWRKLHSHLCFSKYFLKECERSVKGARNQRQINHLLVYYKYARQEGWLHLDLRDI